MCIGKFASREIRITELLIPVLRRMCDLLIIYYTLAALHSSYHTLELPTHCTGALDLLLYM